MTNTDGLPQKPLSMSEMADYLGVSYKWLSEQVAAGRVPCTRIGKIVKFFPAHVRHVADHGIDIKKPAKGTQEPPPVRRRRRAA